MSRWTFYDYVTADGRNWIQDWYAVQDAGVQAQFDAILLILAGLEDWESKGMFEWFKPLVGKHAGLGEIRFHVDAWAPGARNPHRRRFRPVGIWPCAVEREFVLLLGCEKSGRSYMPHAAFDRALVIKNDFEKGKGSIREHIL